MRLLVAALVGVAGFAAPAGAGPCAVHPLVPSVKTVNGTSIPGDGGVLVGLLPIGDWSQPGNSNLAKTTWRFVDGTKEVEPVIRVIAPGLAVYAPPAGTTEIKLNDAKRTLVSVNRIADAKPRLPAPAVKSIISIRTTPPPSPRASNSSQVTANLMGPRPDGAVAMIVFVAGKPATPVSWVSAFGYQGPTGELEVYRTPDRCAPSIPGISEPPAGARVTLAWVDGSGRIGAPSQEIVITKGRPKS